MEWDEDDDEDDKEGGGLLYDIVAEMVGDWSKGDLPPYNFLQSVLIIVFFLSIFCPRCKKKKKCFDPSTDPCFFPLHIINVK